LFFRAKVLAEALGEAFSMLLPFFKKIVKKLAELTFS
jgi:hypothetical protein